MTLTSISLDIFICMDQTKISVAEASLDGPKQIYKKIIKVSRIDSLLLKNRILESLVALLIILVENLKKKVKGAFVAEVERTIV